MLSNRERRILSEIEAELTSASSRRMARRAGIVRVARRLLTIAVLIAAVVLCASAGLPGPASTVLISLSAVVLGAVLATMLHRCVVDLQWRLRYRRYRRR